MLSLAKAFSQGMPPANVNVVEAKEQSLTPVSWFSGTVVSQNNSHISAEVSGRIEWIAPLGATFKKDDVIARIDGTRLKIQLDENLASVKSAQSRYDFQVAEVKRQSALAKKNLSAANALDETISLRDIAKGELEAAKARLAQTRQDLLFTEVKAPFNGLIAERLSSVGELINNGTAIVRLVQLENLEASIFAPITAYRFVQQVKDLAIESSLGKGSAPIKSVVPVANLQSHLMEVRLDMSDVDWPVGLSMKAAVVTGKVKTALAVPRDALVLRRQGTFVFRVNEDNTAEQIPVELGLSSGEFIEIKGNVALGDKIIVRGAERLQPGQAVAIKQSNSNLVSGQQ
ncbi:efflux RND transporter periplasmic adaptor subunit [Pleionea sediminis]|uniref:efflux RND transporter periplasmic adaptor subunit n=1 Tax=Pleionea sediminis TaxID=2569479 RepID=UPI0013DE4119|nr:efflux RND transporter periplasmic adaptor subunit [Pleionea sediminis]